MRDIHDPGRGPGHGTLILLGGAAVGAVLGVYLLRGGDPVLVMMAAAAAVAGAVAVFRPLIGIAALSIILVANVSDNLIMQFGMPSMAKLIAPGLAGVLVARYAIHGERPLVDAPATLLMGGYAVLIGASAVWAYDSARAVEVLDSYVRDLVVVLLALAYFSRPGALRTFMNAGAASLAVICALGLWQYVTSYHPTFFWGFSRFMYQEARLSGPINDPNFFAAVLVFFIPMALRDAAAGRSIPARFAGLATALLLLAALLVTGSRGGLLALLLALGVFALMLGRRAIVTGGVLVAACLVVATTVFPDALLERFSLLFADTGEVIQNDVAVEGRLASWSVAYHQFLDHPLLGVGAGNLNTHFQDYALDLDLIFRGEGRSAHSLYLEVLSELGLVGIGWIGLIMVGAMIGVSRALWIDRDAGAGQLYLDHAAFGIGLLGYLAAMTFLHDSYPRLLYTVLAVGIAMPRVARAELAAQPAEGAGARGERAARGGPTRGGPVRGGPARPPAGAFADAQN